MNQKFSGTCDAGVCKSPEEIFPFVLRPEMFFFVHVGVASDSGCILPNNGFLFSTWYLFSKKYGIVLHCRQ